MTVDEIYDNVKKNGIPVGLDAWMPSNKTKDEEETAWKEYIPKMENPTDSFRKTLAASLYGRGISNTEAEAFFQQAEKEQKEKEQKEKEALEYAKMYFG